MLNISLKNTSLLTIIAGALLVTVYSLPLNTQTPTSESISENLELKRKNDWTFPTEEESISIQDELEQLEEYSISEPNTETKLEITEENRKLENQNGVEDYSVEVEVYDY